LRVDTGKTARLVVKLFVELFKIVDVPRARVRPFVRVWDQAREDCVTAAASDKVLMALAVSAECPELQIPERCAGF